MADDFEVFAIVAALAGGAEPMNDYGCGLCEHYPHQPGCPWLRAVRYIDKHYRQAS